jgi:hypothetical protein
MGNRKTEKRAQAFFLLAARKGKSKTIMAEAINKGGKGAQSWNNP